jgi:hypothetical protein
LGVSHREKQLSSFVAEVADEFVGPFLFEFRGIVSVVGVRTVLRLKTFVLLALVMIML